MITADDLIRMKNEEHDMFGNVYNFILLDIENFLVSKSDPKGRILSRYDNLDKKAKLMVLLQSFF